MIKLLIVEDDKSQIQAFKDTIESYNKKNSNIIDTPSFKSDLKSALADLDKKPSYDSAIIDLKLSSGAGADDFEGKELIAKIYCKIRIPIVVYSGNVSQVEHEETTLFLKRQRDKFTILQILDEIKGIYNTGITEILSSDGIFENNLSGIFWSHLAPHLKHWIDHPDKKSLTRYILNHIHDKLEISDSGEFEDFNPAEVYIVPPIKTNIHTGDIFITGTDNKYLVVTPSCDIEIKKKKDGKLFRKADYLTVLKLNDFDVKSFCRNPAGKVDKGLIIEYISNKSNRFQYLPPFLNDNGFILDFEEALHLKLTLDIKFNRIASVSQIFLKDIISRFSQYYARQGQPLLGNSNELASKLFEKNNQS